MKIGPGNLSFHATQSFRHFRKRVHRLFSLALHSEGQAPQQERQESEGHCAQ